MIIAKAGDEYSTSAPAECRILGRAKSCGVVTPENEPLVQLAAAAIVRLGASLPAAIAEAIQYFMNGGTLTGLAATPRVVVPKMEKKYGNLRAVRDAENSNACGDRARQVVAAMLA